MTVGINHFFKDTDREQFLTGIMLTRILIQIHARDAENSLENARSKTNISLDAADIRHKAFNILTENQKCYNKIRVARYTTLGIFTRRK